MGVENPEQVPVVVRERLAGVIDQVREVSQPGTVCLERAV